LKKTIVVGLDGACWELIDPWLKQGVLPNMQKLLAGGAYSDSYSQLPPVTCPNWKCFSTGKNPAKFGVFWWKRPDREHRKMVSFDARTFQSYEYFDYLNSAGLKVGIINMPLTFPPKAVDGFIITGGPDSGDKGFTYPEDLEAELIKKYNYRVHPPRSVGSKEDVESEVDEILRLIDLRFRVGLDYLDQVDLLQITTFYLNVFQHFFYRGEASKKAWQIVDRYLGQLMQMDVNLLLISDHGIHPINTVFYINSWLHQQGYLTLAGGKVRGLRKLGITKERAIRYAETLKIKKLLETVIPRKIRGAVPYSDGTIAVHATADQINWDRSSVLGSGQGTIYMLLDPDDPNYEKIRTEIIEKIKTLKDPRTGQNIASAVYKKEDYYHGEFLHLAPDIIFEQAHGVYTLAVLGKDEVFTPPQKWEAENLRYGLFLAYGKDIKPGFKLGRNEIVDVAPTILHWLGYQVPDDMDGRVLTEIFAPDSEPARRPVQKFAAPPYTTTETGEVEEDAEIIERLRDLGYMEQ